MISAYNIAFVIFVYACMALRIFPRHFGLPDGDMGYWIFGAIWFVGMIAVLIVTPRVVTRPNSPTPKD